MWQHLSLRCCQKYASSTESSTGREGSFFLKIKFSMPDFTFTVSLRVNPNRVPNWLEPLLTKQKKRGHSLNIPLKWKIRQWWSSVGLGGIHMNKIGRPTFFHFIEFRSGNDANSQMCRRIWHRRWWQRQLYPTAPTSIRTRKLNHPQRLRFDHPVLCYNLWILLFHLNHILCCFHWKE